jgi:predicted  nucleic acid-binding Zn-ribbon protein
MLQPATRTIVPGESAQAGVRGLRRLRRMARSVLERRLSELSDRMKQLRVDLAVAEEQLAHFTDEADDARLRALVAETPLAAQVHRDAEKHAAAMRRHREELMAEIHQLERAQDDLLDRLMADRS